MAPISVTYAYYFIRFVSCMHHLVCFNINTCSRGAHTHQCQDPDIRDKMVIFTDRNSIIFLSKTSYNC